MSIVVLGDFMRGLVYKLQLENEELRAKIDKKDWLYTINKDE